MMALRARMALWRRIWVMATLGERAVVMLAGAAGMLVIAALGAWFGQTDETHPLRKAFLLGGTPIAVVACLWWATFCGGAARQNSPANAALVPGLNRALRQCTALVFVLTMLSLLPLVWKHPDGAAVYPQMAMALTGLGLYRAGRHDGFVVLVLIVLLYVFGSASQSWTMFLVHPIGVAIASLLACGYAVWALPRAFPVGGERHWRMRRAQQLARAQNDLVEWEKARRGRGRRFRLNSWVLMRDTRKGGHPADMLLHGLGPGNHRYHVPVAIAAVTALFLIVRAALALLAIPAPNLIGMAGTLTAVIITTLLSASWSRYGFSVRSTPVEQSVLRLAPAVPAAPALNRVLGRRILVICLAEWCVATLLVLGMVWLWGGSGTNVRVVLLMAACTLACIGISLQDFAHKEEINTWKNGALMLWTMLVLMLGVVHSGDTALWLVMLAVQLATSSMYIALRWRRMQRALVAFPAGRMT